MTYQEFIDELTRHLTEQLPEGTALHISKVLKNNGLQKYCLTISTSNNHMIPAIYLDHYYRLACQGTSIPCIAEDIITGYLQRKDGSGIDTSMLTDPALIREHVVYRLINREQNRELLKTVPHMLYLDLAIVFYLVLPCKDQDFTATALIHQNHMENWHLTTEDLMQLATRNTARILPWDMMPVVDMLDKILHSEHLSPEKQNEFHGGCTPFYDGRTPLYVLTNNRCAYGAACMLYPELLADIAEKWQTDLYILPSSIHEILLLPANIGFTLEKLTAMVLEVNATQLDPEDVLSDHAYRYIRRENKVIY